MSITRYIENKIEELLSPDRAIILYGPRRVGKTTIINKLKAKLEKTKKVKFVNGDDRSTWPWLSSQTLSKLTEFIGDAEILIIDEAQYIDKIGVNLKLIVDNIPTVSVIATGSSSFELSNQVGEPLVGRKWQFTLYPFSQLELNNVEDVVKTSENLEHRLIYGGFPEVVLSTNLETKMAVLESIIDNYLQKDLFVYEEVRKSQKIIDLLALIAFQIGNEVSLNELSITLGIDVKTVAKYLDLLEKVFVIKRVRGFSRNLRKEITKTARYYFLDNGIRNAIIQNFNPLNRRNDVGMLWENYLFIERLKKREYQKIYANIYFWRTYDQKEIDLIEERDGKLYGYEFKWGSKTAKAPKLWLETYDNAEFHCINKENYLDFIS